jgi:hypothetical protein
VIGAVQVVEDHQQRLVVGTVKGKLVAASNS